MHLHLILTSLGIAGLVRHFLTASLPRSSNWRDRWQHTLFAFLFPPLLLLATAIAVLCMGVQGEMLGLAVGRLGYLMAVSFLAVMGGVPLVLGIQAGRSLWQLRQQPQITLNDDTARLLDSPLPFAAQVGFWRPQLVLSQGLLGTLTHEQVQAVLTHEQAHVHYHDTFWFFWLGCIRRCTAWLPHTVLLWEELLLLRELRADRWAAQRVDGLLLAETLLLLVQTPTMPQPIYTAAFGSLTCQNRLTERIDALLAPPADAPPLSLWDWFSFFLAAMPVLTLLLHR